VKIWRRLTAGHQTLERNFKRKREALI